jgi:type IV secretory pathway TrbD component
MLQELAASTGAALPVILSLFFFVASFGLVLWLVSRADPAELEARRQLPFDDPGQGRR